MNIGKYLHDKAEYLVSVSVQQIKQYLFYRISSRNELTSSPPQGEMWRTMLGLTNRLPGYTTQTVLASLASLARLPAWVISENYIFQPLLLSFKIIFKINDIWTMFCLYPGKKCLIRRTPCRDTILEALHRDCPLPGVDQQSDSENIISRSMLSRSGGVRGRLGVWEMCCNISLSSVLVCSPLQGVFHILYCLNIYYSPIYYFYLTSDHATPIHLNPSQTE